MDRSPRRRLFSLCRHEWMHRSAPGRWWLECFKCGNTTPGLQLAVSTRPPADAAGGPAPSEIESLLHVVRAEYMERPGLRLTVAEAQRLWDLDGVTCERMLRALVDRGFLYRRRNATYARTDDPPVRSLLSRCRASLRAVATDS